jgi:hypothetical protein
MLSVTMGRPRLGTIHPAPYSRHDPRWNKEKDLPAEAFTPEFMAALIGLPFQAYHEHTEAVCTNLGAARQPKNAKTITEAMTQRRATLPTHEQVISDALRAKGLAPTMANIAQEMREHKYTPTAGCPLLGKVLEAFQDPATGEIRVLLDVEPVTDNPEVGAFLLNEIQTHRQLGGLSLSTEHYTEADVYVPIELSACKEPWRAGCGICPGPALEQYLTVSNTMATPVQAVPPATSEASNPGPAVTGGVPPPRTARDPRNGQYVSQMDYTAFKGFVDTLSPEQKAVYMPHEMTNQFLLTAADQTAATLKETQEQHLAVAGRLNQQKYDKEFRDSMVGLLMKVVTENQEVAAALGGADNVQRGLEKDESAGTFANLVMASLTHQHSQKSAQLKQLHSIAPAAVAATQDLSWYVGAEPANPRKRPAHEELFGQTAVLQQASSTKAQALPAGAAHYYDAMFGEVARLRHGPR